jgi:CRISPR/Cas system CSM-associated protein Csm5 (group 7 of RAMP superfamily)
MSNISNPLILPFKCEEVLIKLGSSCEQQKEIYDNLYKLQTGEVKIAPLPLGYGSGLGDSSWREALNYEEDQKILAKKLGKEAQEKSTQNISEIQTGTNKKDYLIYGIGLVLIAGVVIYEFKRKKI